MEYTNFFIVHFLSLLLVDIEPAQSSVKFSDIGGCEETVEQVCKLLVHMKHPEVFRTLGVTPPRGFLLHGPPGCGKTLLAHAIAGVGKVTLLKQIIQMKLNRVKNPEWPGTNKPANSRRISGHCFFPFRKIAIFRRERSDDWKCVCCSQARGKPSGPSCSKLG